MSTSTAGSMVQSAVEPRVLQEGYGPGAWHGPDLKAAIGDVEPAAAFWRPAAGRHNIAEIALHHAYFVRSVRAQVSGGPVEPFALDGEEWFELNDGGPLPWPKVRAIVDEEHQRLTALVTAVAAGNAASAVPEDERFGLVLGITAHAIYHAGQVQLLKRLQAK